MPSRIVAFYITCIVAKTAWCDPPKLNALYPAGVQHGQTAIINLQGSWSNWPVQAWSSSEGMTFEAIPDKKGEIKVTATADSRRGLQWLRIWDAEGASTLRPFIVGSLSEANELEPNNETAQHQLVSLPTTINGRLEKNGDVDGFVVDLQAGQQCVVSVFANWPLGSPMDAVLQIASSDGFVLAQNDDERGIDPQVVFQVPTTGKYLIRLFAFPLTPTSSIAFAGADTFIYRMTITTGPFIDHVVPLVRQADQISPLALLGWNLPDKATTTNVVRVGLYGWPFPEGPLQEGPSPDISGGLPIVEWTPHPVVVEEADNSPEHPQPIQVPADISGHIEAAGDIDDYRLAAKSGQQLSFTIEARSMGAALDGVLQLRDSQGKVLSESDDARRDVDPSLSFKVPADGDYLVRIADVFGHGGPRYYYRLVISDSQPDFSLQVATDTVVGNVGKPIELNLTIDRQNGFDGEIEYKVIGAPDGLELSLAKDSPPKAAKLSIVSSVPIAGIPIQIQGTSQKEPRQIRRVTHEVAGTRLSSESLWLTIKP